MTDARYIQVILPLKLEWVPYYRIPDSISAVVEAGDKVRVNFSGREYIGVVRNLAERLPEDLPASKVRPIKSVETALARVRKEEIELWQQIADYYMCTVGEVFKTACPAQTFNREEIEARKKERLKARVERLRESLEKARASKRVKESTRERLEAELAIQQAKLEEKKNASVDTGIVLNSAQNEAIAGVRSAFKAKKVALLHGVTGSGKTEIYSKLAAEALAKGRNVLYLVPEIALSRQLEERLETFFGEDLLVFHSHETQARRGQVATTVAGSTNYIVLGTRSAIFLPHHDLGLVIVDEEHDSSYKQDSPAPRYNGRDVAIMLAKSQGADVILGSATPSLEALFNCQAGRFSEISLNEKYHGGEPVEVELIDTRAERKKRGMHGSFSRKLIQHISETLEEGAQVLILRSRRSYSPAVQCTECGDIPKCPRCNVSLSLHKTASNDRLVCHHCGYSVKFDGSCQKCGGAMEGLGAGTQKIEEEAAALFPAARIARLDSDVAKNPKEEAKVVKEFAEGRTDMLIGTQMVSKGFDFEKLKLVAVMQADSMLAVQDFRADERAVQLLEQVRGRCARRGGKGLFVIQTSKPEHPVYTRFTEDSRGFEENLLSERKDFGYPPFYRLIYINVRDTYADKADRMAAALNAAVQMALGRRMENGSAGVMGPYVPAKEIEDGRHTRTIRVSLARSKDLAAAKAGLRKAVIAFEIQNRYDGHITIDVDPV